MMRHLLGRMTYANVMATIAVFLALGGTGYALSIPRNSVGSAQIKKGAVTRPKIQRGAVTTLKVKDRSLKAVDLKAGHMLVWRGAWDSGIAYSKNSVVQGSGSSWVATRRMAAGESPASGDWRVFAAEGPPGSPGADGTFATSGFHVHTACVNSLTGNLSLMAHSAKGSCVAGSEVPITLVTAD